MCSDYSILAEFVPVTVTFKSVLIWFPSCSIAGIVQLFLGGVELVTIMSFIIEINEDLLASLDLLKQYFLIRGNFAPKVP